MGQQTIYVVNAGGGGKRRLAEPTTSKRDIISEGPAWAPDSSKLAYTRSVEDRSFFGDRVFVVDVDGGKQARLGVDVDGSDPRWAPDGQRVLYESSRSGHGELYAMSADGSNDERLTYTGSDDEEGNGTGDGAWSPDGSQIAYTSRLSDNVGIYVMRSDGTDRRYLAKASADLNLVSWSPDGSKIAYESFKRLYVMNAGGSDRRSVSRIDFLSAYSWFPDGQRLVFLHAGRIRTADLGTGRVRPISKPSPCYANPSVSPDGTKIAFVNGTDDCRI